MKVMSANRGLNIATGVINILAAIGTGIFGLVMTVALALGFGLSSGLNNDPVASAEAERMLVIVDWFFAVSAIAAVALLVCAILLFIPKIRYKFIMSIISIISLVSVAAFTAFFADLEVGTIILYALIAIVCILHLVNIFVKGEYKGKLLNDVNAFAKVTSADELEESVPTQPVNVVTEVENVTKEESEAVEQAKEDTIIPPRPPQIDDENK